MQDALPQQVWSLPQPVALSRLRRCLLEKEAIPPHARTGEDRGTAPYGKNDSAVPFNLQDEPRNGGRGLPRTLIVADTLVSPLRAHTHFQSSADLRLQGKRGSSPSTQDEPDKVSLCFAAKEKKKVFPFPEKRRMMSTYVDFQAVSHVPPLCLPIRPWDRVTAGWCHATQRLLKCHCIRALSVFIWVITILLNSILLLPTFDSIFCFPPPSSPPPPLFHGGQL